MDREKHQFNHQWAIKEMILRMDCKEVDKAACKWFVHIRAKNISDGGPMLHKQVCKILCLLI
jgi:hypothetical protein